MSFGPSLEPTLILIRPPRRCWSTSSDAAWHSLSLSSEGFSLGQCPQRYDLFKVSCVRPMAMANPIARFCILVERHSLAMCYF